MLRAGAGTAVIRFPEQLFPMEGFCGIHDDPHARIILLEAGERVAIASLELVMLPEAMIATLKALIAEVTGVKQDHIWIHMTHAITTPHAPGGMGPGGQPKMAAYALYEEAVCAAVQGAAVQAVQSMEEACMGIGGDYCDINVNRDIQTPYGWWISNHGDGLSNKLLSLIKLETIQHRPIAYMMSYGIKPCAIDNSMMKENKRVISTDVPGFACAKMEQVLGAPVLFLMSAAGDQIPTKQALYDQVLPGGNVKTVDHGVDYGLDAVAQLGNKMAQVAIDAARDIECRPVSRRIQISRISMSWPEKQPVAMHPRNEMVYTPADRTKAVPVEVCVIGPAAFVATKPEVNCITEMELKKSSPFKYTFLVTMVNGGMKYMPDQTSYDNITWEAMNSMLMPGAAEAFVRTAGQLLKRTGGS